MALDYIYHIFMGWKIFFWIYSLLSILSILDPLPNPTLIDLVGYPLTLVELAALFSYAYKRELWDKQFWKILTYLYLGFFIVFGLGELTPLGAMVPALRSSQFRGMPAEQRVAALLVTLVIFIPIAYAMYKVTYTKLTPASKPAKPVKTPSKKSAKKS